MIRIITEEWKQPTRQPRSLIPIRRNQSRNIKTILLKLVITTHYTPEHRVLRTLTLYTVFKLSFQRDSLQTLNKIQYHLKIVTSVISVTTAKIQIGTVAFSVAMYPVSNTL